MDSAAVALLDRLDRGSEVVVTTRDGSRLQDRFEEVTDHEIVVLIERSAVPVPRSAVAEILLVKQRETRPGSLMLGIGGATGFLVVRNHWRRETRGFVTRLGAATGASAGYFVGRFIQSGETSTTSEALCRAG